jgi:signal transduction histidine kinase
VSEPDEAARRGAGQGEDDEIARLRRELDGARAASDAAVRRLRAVEHVADAALEHLDEEDLLAEVLRRVRHVLGADVAAMHLGDGETALALRAWSGLDAPHTEGAVALLGIGMAGRVARERVAAVVPDTSREPGLPAALRDAVRSLVAVPLTARECVVGVLTVAWAAPREPGEDDRQLLQALAARVALALENARLYGARHERLLDEVRRRAAELQAIVSAIADGLVVNGPRGEILHANATARRVLNYGDGDLGTTYVERMRLYRPHDAKGRPIPPDRHPVARALRGETVSGELLRLDFPPGEKWIRVSAAPIRDAGGALLGTVTTFADVTRQREVDEQREDLLRSVSHDLRTPLTSVLLQAQRLGRSADADVRRRADAIVSGVRRMDALIRDLVESARLETGQIPIEPRPLHVGRFLAELLSRTPALDASRVVLDADPGAFASADPERIERVVVNLLSNALKYSRPGSRVRVWVRSEAGEIVTSVEDEGDGIPPEELPRIFGRYYRSERTRSVDGTGLGLYITRLLVEAHRGRIRAESIPGRGSTFRFTLPAVTAPVAERNA